MTNKVLTFGEILLRLSPPNYQRFTQASSFEAIYGGAEANVAVSLANFGIETDFLTRIPNNALGNACINYLRQFGVNTDKILRGGDRLGKYFFEKGASIRSGKVIYDRAHSAISTSTNEMYNWDLIFKDISWFHWTGITPALSESLANVCLNAIKVAKERNITISCDLNYRNKLWNYGKTPIEVMPELIKNCNILIGSEFNIRKMLDIALSDEQLTSDRNQTERNQKIMKKVMKKYPNLEFVGFTMRDSISSSHNTLSGLLYDRNETYSSPTYDIDFIVDRVGGGDAFNAGLLYGLLKFKDDLQKVLDFAVAAAALKHSIEGDFNLVSKSEVEKLMKGHSSGLISR